MSCPAIPLKVSWGATNHPNGEPLDIHVTHYQYWKRIAILRINKLNNDKDNFDL